MKNCSKLDLFDFPDKIKNIFFKLDKFFKNLNVFCFILVMVFLTDWTFPLAFILPNDNSVGPKAIESSSLIIQLILAVLITPLVETLIVQKWVILVCRKLWNNNTIAVIISAFIFGISHTYSIVYVINTSFIGIVLAYSYIVYEQKEQSSYWIVCVIHALRNFITWILLNFIC